MYVFLFYRYIIVIGSLEKQDQQKQKSAHLIMEVEKSHNLASARQRPRKGNGVIQTESENLGRMSINAQEQEKMEVSAQAERINSPFLCLFVLVGPSTEWTTLVRAIFI